MGGGAATGGGAGSTGGGTTTGGGDGTGGGSAAGGGAATGGGAGVPVTTADLTWNGANATLTPDVRRGFTWLQPIEKVVYEPLATPPTMSCAPTPAPEQGGRYIRVNSLSIAGNFSGPCSSNPARFTAADTSLTNSARNNCDGRSSCRWDPSEAVDLLLGECNPSQVVITWDYRCTTLTPAPAFVFEAASASPGPIIITGLDGAGTATCAERGAAFYVNNARWQVSDSTPCTINFTTRTEHSLAGTVTATLVNPADSSLHTLAIQLRHDTNGLRPNFSINTGSDLCTSTSITHTRETVGADAFDVFVTGPLQCQVNTASPLPAVTIRRKVPTGSEALACGQGGRIDFSTSTHSTATNQGGCQTSFVVSETPSRLRYAFYNLAMCDGSGCVTHPVAYFAHDLP